MQQYSIGMADSLQYFVVVVVFFLSFFLFLSCQDYLKPSMDSVDKLHLPLKRQS